MSRCCVLSNPSTDMGTLMNQRCYLKKLAGDLANPDPDHKCTMCICVSADALEQSIKNLPATFCFKVVVPDTKLPITGIETCSSSKPALDEVSKAILNRYIKPDSVVTVIDTSEPSLPSPEWFKECMGSSSSDSELIIFTVGKDLNSSRIEKWSSSLDIKHTLLQYVDPNDITTILAHCEKHILTGNLVGWWGAVLSGSNAVACPSPWAPGVTLDYPDKWKLVKCAWNYTKYFSHAYYINLDRRPDRRQHMENQLIKSGFTASRIQAVDGKNIPWKPEYGVISNYWNHGAFAYCLSYRVAIIDAMRNGYENVLIMDDDCVLQDNMWDILDKAWSNMPDEWHMLYFGANHGPANSPNIPTESVGEHLYRLKGSMGSHAIIVNKHCYKTFLNYLAAPYAPFDMFLSIYQKFFPCYITYPGIAFQLSGVSDIINKDIDYSKEWGVDYINHIPSRVGQ